MTTFAGIKGILENKNSDVSAAKAAAFRWLLSIERRGIEISRFRKNILKATSLRDVVEVLTSSVLPRLDREADAAGLVAANQIMVATVLCPRGSLDAAMFILRAVRLVREIAVIYGMRPSMLGTYALLHRVMFGATTVAVANLRVIL